MKVILFPNNGALPDIPPERLRLARFGATDEEASAHALSIVPAGVPFLVVDESDVPADRTYREAWEADFSTPDGLGGAA